YTSGLRAPAIIAVVKDTLIYITVLALVIVVPYELGGFGNVSAAVPPEKLLLPTPGAGTLGQYSAYATLALGSAFALFLYPHTMRPCSARAVRRSFAVTRPIFRRTLFCSDFWHSPASWHSRLVSRRCRNSRLNSSNTNRTSRSRHSSCILFPIGSQAWP